MCVCVYMHDCTQEKSIMMEQEWTKENVEAFISSVLFGKETEMAQGVSPPSFSGESQNVTEDSKYHVLVWIGIPFN